MVTENDGLLDKFNKFFNIMLNIVKNNSDKELTTFQNILNQLSSEIGKINFDDLIADTTPIQNQSTK